MQNVNAKKLFGSLWKDAPEDLIISSVVTDSRDAQPGSVFVAINGERVDGHNFAASAFDRGARVLVCTRPVPAIDLSRTVIVDDILDALIQLGANYRAMFNPKVLAVTGSVGKTTTKEFCGAMLSEFGETVSTLGNQNNEIGMPNTMFRINDKTRYVAVEMGMQGLGEIHKLTMAARPDVGIITSIGLAHIERLGTMENTLKAKLEICDGMKEGSPLILSFRDNMLKNASLPSHINPVYVGIGDDDCDVRVRDVVRERSGQSFTLQDREYGEHRCYIPPTGEHMAYDAAIAFAGVVRLGGIDPEIAAKGLANFKTAGMRQNIKIVRDIYVVEDCYNANPDSMKAAMSIMAEMQVTGKKIAVLGDMLELGKSAIQEHKNVAAYCVEAGIDLIITVGSLAAIISSLAEHEGVESYVCATNEDAGELIKELAKAGDAVLFKASRGMHFEEILKIFYDGQTKFY